jgi:hypothetical protein
MELRADRWAVEPVEVRAVRSSFFEDTRLFPPGSATLDCALLMRDIPVTWTALQPMPTGGALFAFSGATTPQNANKAARGTPPRSPASVGRCRHPRRCY